MYNDVRLPTQNSKFRAGKLKSKKGKVKKITFILLKKIPFLPTLFKKRAGTPGLEAGNVRCSDITRVFCFLCIEY